MKRRAPKADRPAGYLHAPVAWCRTCGKDSYSNRKSARHRLRKTPGGNRGMREYRCPADDRHWHLGHLPQAVVAGVATADEVYGRTA